MQPEIRDKLSPIVAIMNYELVASSKSQSNSDLLPILDYFLPRNVSTSVSISCHSLAKFSVVCVILAVIFVN